MTPTRKSTKPTELLPVILAVILVLSWIFAYLAYYKEVNRVKQEQPVIVKEVIKEVPKEVVKEKIVNKTHVFVIKDNENARYIHELLRACKYNTLVVVDVNGDQYTCQKTKITAS